MGQSFDDDGMYIGWSPLFNYSSAKMLEISKTIPIPRGYTLTVSEETQYSIEEELNNIINSTGEQKLKNLIQLIYKIDDNKGKYNYSILTNKEEKEKIINQIQRHENYKVSYSYKEKAFKNVASANIRNVVHNIRNRDQAYSPITMKDLQKEADNSPKGAETKQLNMINPLTKYIMQNQNLVGKNVIGIAANGEKDWFNLTYYYHNILRTGNSNDKFFIKMSHQYNRLSGRATNHLEQVVIKHIPDLWNASPELTEKIKKEFYSTYDGEINMEDKYVDQLISQLLSAATDNAKELILAKINAGTNLAKYYLHLIMMGFKLQDIVSFMTSPAVELIDKYSNNNLYNKKAGSVYKAIKLLQGDVEISNMITKPTSKLSADQMEDRMQAELEAAEAQAEIQMELASQGIFKKITKQDYPWIISELGKIYYKVGAKSLKDFFRMYIRAKTGMEDIKEFKDYTLKTTKNMNTNQLFKYIDQIVSDIKSVMSDKYGITAFMQDLEEFSQITEQANETSTLASVWLKLNQGIPQTDIELIKLIKRMKSSVSTREYKMGIKKPTDAESQDFVTLADSDEESPYSNTKEKLKDQISKCLDSDDPQGKDKKESWELKKIKQMLLNIQQNNSTLTDNEIENILYDALDADLYGNFDLYKFLNNEQVSLPESRRQYNSRKGDLVSYRELAASYYNLIKSSWNILDIVNRIPHYQQNIDLLNYTLQQRHLFSNKAKIVDQLVSLGELSFNNLSDKNYKDIVSYTDKIIITSYFLSQKEPIDISEVDNAKVFNSNYQLKQSDELYLNSLNGIDSLKRFVENEFYEWLKDTYPQNSLVKELIQSSNKGKSMLRTSLNLFDIDQSLTNKQTYNRYLIGIKELANEKMFGQYSVADILILYNLAVNGTKLGGKYLTGIFRDSVKNTILYDYYKFISQCDYSNDTDYILPTKRDLLIYIAPTVFSQYSLQFRTEPYVKVLNPLHGYDVYRRVWNNDNKAWEYLEKPEPILDLDNLGLTQVEIDERIQNYVQNSLVLFPELHKRLKENNIVRSDNTLDKNGMINLLTRYSRQNRLLIYKLC